MIDPLSLVAGIWIGGAILGCWGVYSTKALLPDWLRYLIAVIWPIALPGYCILWVGGLVWHVVKGIFEKESV